MSAVIVFLSLPIFVSALKEVTVKPGQDAALQCRGPRDAQISLLEWSRPELLSHGYVFFFQDQRSYENYQHESFKGRVELRDPSMRDGDVSVILRNVSFSDAGTYECLITTSSIKGGGGVTEEFKHSISLTVTASGFTDENTKERGHKDGGHKDGGHKDGGHKDGGHKDGGHKDGGHKDGGHKEIYLSVIVSLTVFVVLMIAIVCIITRRNSKEPSDRNRLPEMLNS